jgi:hypothetical protein
MVKAMWFLGCSILAAAVIFALVQFSTTYYNQQESAKMDRYFFATDGGYITAVADKQTGVVRYATGQTWDFLTEGATITGRGE